MVFPYVDFEHKYRSWYKQGIGLLIRSHGAPIISHHPTRRVKGRDGSVGQSTYTLTPTKFIQQSEFAFILDVFPYHGIYLRANGSYQTCAEMYTHTREMLNRMFRTTRSRKKCI